MTNTQWSSSKQIDIPEEVITKQTYNNIEKIMTEDGKAIK